MKKIVIVIFVLIAVILGIGVGIVLNVDKQAEPTVSDIENKVEDIATNVVKKNEIDKDNEIQNVEEQYTVIEEKNEEEKTDLEKSIDIVSKDWGEDDNVYFSNDGQNNKGEYIICVRQKSSTSALAWYIVNAETGEFIKE